MRNKKVRKKTHKMWNPSLSSILEREDSILPHELESVTLRNLNIDVTEPAFVKQNAVDNNAKY